MGVTLLGSAPAGKSRLIRGTANRHDAGAIPFATNLSAAMATSIPSTCEATNQSLLQESGRIGPDLYIRSALQQPIVGLMQQNRGVWRNGMGTVVSTTTFERNLPTSIDDNWENIGVSDGADADACLPPVEEVGFGQTTRSYQPRHYALETEDFCIRDILQGWQYAQNLNAMKRALAEVTAWTWFRRFTIDYETLSGNHWSMNLGGVVNNGTTYSVSALANAAIDYGILETIHTELGREAIDGNGAMYDVDTNDRVYPLLIGKEAWALLLRNNAALRDDLRYAYQGTKEGMPLLPGATKFRNFGGFRAMITPYPRRFNFTGGAYVEVPVWTSSATTKGTKREISTAWKNATYEEAIVYHPDVYQSEAVNTVAQPAPGWNFDPINWMGEFRWVNEYHRQCNPDRTKGFWRAVFADAARPINPLAGHVIMYKRCGFPIDLATCSYT